MDSSKTTSRHLTSSEHFRAGFVGLIGKPNVGKSTMLNAFVGRKISITSPRPQTTRHRILGILTRPDAQVIFMDSPGWTSSPHRLGRYLIAVARGVLEEVDVVLMVLDAHTGITIEDTRLFEHVRQAKRPAILAINKIDLVNKRLLLPLLDACGKLTLFEELIPVSAVTGENMTVLLNQAIARLPVGPAWYEQDRVTDQSVEQLIREFIREPILHTTKQEVPYAVAVLLDELTHKETVTVICATIVVEREGQKAILIGQKGHMLKRIGQTARQELEGLLGRKIYLKLWVKVAKDWRADTPMLRQLGYTT